MIKREAFSKLKDMDIYSLSMFTLYKLTDIPEYSPIGELPYILDQDNMLKLCRYFGGRQLRIPTLNELYTTMNLLLLYQYVNIEGKAYDEAVVELGYESKDLRKVKKAYNEICNVLKKYNFETRNAYGD